MPPPLQSLASSLRTTIGRAPAARRISSANLQQRERDVRFDRVAPTKTDRGRVFNGVFYCYVGHLPPIGRLTVYDTYGKSTSLHTLWPGDVLALAALLPPCCPESWEEPRGHELSGTDLPRFNFVFFPVDPPPPPPPDCELCSEPIAASRPGWRTPARTNGRVQWGRCGRDLDAARVVSADIPIPCCTKLCGDNVLFLRHYDDVIGCVIAPGRD